MPQRLLTNPHLIAIRKWFGQLWAKNPNFIFIGPLLTAIIMISMVTLELQYERREILAHAAENAGNLSLIVERDISRNLELFDNSLQAVVNGVNDPAVMQMPGNYRRSILFDRAVTESHFMGGVAFIDANGNNVVNSLNYSPFAGNYKEQSWFTAHKNNPVSGLYISPPKVAHDWDNKLILLLSRRVSHIDGSFAGVVVGGIELDYFRQLLSGLKLGEHSSVVLIQNNGTIVMRIPYREKLIGSDISHNPNFKRYLQLREPYFIGVSSFDGEERLLTFKAFDNLPFTVNVGTSTRDMLAEWRRHALYIGILSGVLVLALLITTWFLTQEFKRRLTVEKDLFLLSREDGLTGIHNRRMLDERLPQEWQRVQRNHQPLSILFIDIDWFKRYNDTYGHHTGDEALIAVARGIASCVQRPADILARFGGEEFVVVLPETGKDGAHRVAEKIIACIRALQIEHIASPEHIITVSVGYACSTDLHPADPPMLMAAADVALYQAKSNGRNQSCAYS
ncbi:sensor domain-containing diguanylate cyclase [Leeia oryzae]|uniref:sensor domain-containing diguanylate cyclase n=1 Tax=Leeia oryzae TaxID=356662 RepID=UPI000363CE9F|nr:sensor domain-containing diguanylate cyclase [Leeia oryzae]